jgi:uncharacterized protein YjbI with pentapeptide repeats
VGRKKPDRKAEPPSKRRIAWPRWTGFRGMTVRDWLELLIVPLVLVGIGLLFEMQQAERQQAIEEQQHALEERRAEAERELAVQRAQDEALQAYFDQMSALLLEKDLRASDEDSEVRTLARARTLTVLGRLDPSRKTAVMEFLVEAELVQRAEGGREPIIRLSGANLIRTDLSEANLSGAYLSGVDMCEAYLNGADLGEANLSGAYLCNAELRGADLRSAHLSGADLNGAYLREADLTHVEGVTNEELEQQAYSLQGATMPNGQKYKEWLKDREGSGEVPREVGQQGLRLKSAATQPTKLPAAPPLQRSTTTRLASLWFPCCWSAAVPAVSALPLSLLGASASPWFPRRWSVGSPPVRALPLSLAW